MKPLKAGHPQRRLMKSKKNINDKCIHRIETFVGGDLRFTKAAYRELANYGLSTQDVLDCLNRGTDSGRKRKKGVFEKCLKHDKKIVKVVVAESWDYFNKKMVWAIIHIGRVKSK